MSRTSRIIVIFGLLLATLLLPTAAHAWVSDGQPVFQRGARNAIPYYAANAASLAEARQAVAHWNASGARIRLVPVRSRRAAKIIVNAPMRDSQCFGVARTVFVGRTRVSSTISRSLCRSRDDRVRVLVHEFGHALGLEHELRRCATMNTNLVDSIPARCSDAMGLPKWRYYCTYLEADDIRGMVARYGGRAKLPTKRICDRGPAPAAPTNLTAALTAVDDAHDVTLTWTQPSAPAAITRMWIYQGTCPPAAGSYAMFNADDTPVTSPGVRDITRMGPGTWCVELQALDQWEQPSALVHHQFDVPETVPPT